MALTVVSSENPQKASDRQDPQFISKIMRTDLGTVTQNSNGFFGWTINAPTGYKIPALFGCTKKIKVKWELLSHALQCRWFREIYFPRVIKFHVDWCYACPEITQAGNIHYHCICYSKDMQNEYDMASLRKTLVSNLQCLRIHKGTRRGSLTLNYVHFLDDLPRWLNYLQKDLYKHTLPCIKIKSLKV